MKSITIEKNTFEAHCPFGIDAESDIFDALYYYFDQAYMDLSSELLDYDLGKELPDLIEGDKEGDNVAKGLFVKYMPMSGIKSMVYEYVCKHALYLAIPSLDLVLTNNGFGVVNARDIAPAIPERVNRLRQQCYNDADRAFDQLLVYLPGNSITRDSILGSAAWMAHTRHIVWTARDFNSCCPPSSANESLHNRDALRKASGKLTFIANVMADLISQEQYNTLRDMIRSKEESDNVQDVAIQHLLDWLADSFMSTVTDSRHAHILVQYMEDNIEHFTQYKNSKQYAARHQEKFTTTNRDGWFLFG